jgi:flagella basal body P-ring formation protein FlgA
VKAGELITEADVTLQPIEAGRAPQDAISDASAIVGYAVKRQMRSGQRLRQGDLERPRMLRKGDAVTLIYEVPGMTLTAMGRAMTDGGAGDVISVVNAQSHRTVEARVTGAGTAVVEARATIAPQASLVDKSGVR